MGLRSLVVKGLWAQGFEEGGLGFQALRLCDLGFGNHSSGFQSAGLKGSEAKNMTEHLAKTLNPKPWGFRR